MSSEKTRDVTRRSKGMCLEDFWSWICHVITTEIRLCTVCSKSIFDGRFIWNSLQDYFVKIDFFFLARGIFRLSVSFCQLHFVDWGIGAFVFVSPVFCKGLLGLSVFFVDFSFPIFAQSFGDDLLLMRRHHASVIQNVERFTWGIWKQKKSMFLAGCFAFVQERIRHQRLIRAADSSSMFFNCFGMCFLIKGLLQD